MRTRCSPVPPGAPADTDYDALPLDGIPPFQLPWRLRADENPEWAQAARALYDVPAADTGKAYTDALGAARAKVLAARGDSFPAWVLDRAGIAVMFANRVSVGPGLRRAALPVGAVRRSAALSARHPRRSGAHARHAPPVSPRSPAAAPVPRRARA